MRITSGEFRGRLLDTPSSDLIRPTTDKTRQAIFNALLSRFDLTDAIVLDICSGTGALGLEALSNQAKLSVFIDLNPAHLQLAQTNARHLNCFDRANFQKADATKMPVKTASIPVAHLCFIDPPYRKNIVPAALKSLKDNGWIDNDTYIVVETESEFTPDFPCDFNRLYGDTRIIMFEGTSIL